MKKKKPTAATLARFQAALRKFEQSVDLAFKRYSDRERAANDTYEKAKERAKARLDQITRELMEGKKS
jgi:exonuclease VII small subunit